MGIAIVEAGGEVDFRGMLDFILAEWPPQFGDVPNERKVEEFEKSADAAYDVNKFLVADGARVGWYRYSRWPRDPANLRDAHTLDIAVLQDRRGRGYGKLLMEDLIADCRRRGYKNLKSRTFFDNAVSIALHKSAGFREAFRTEDSIVWEIDL